jgi:hypothetical protein
MIDRLIETKPPVVPGLIVYALMRMDEPARAVAIIQNGITSNDAVFLSLMWSPYGRNVRALPEFPEFARKIGFADVWEKYGAPDDCRRVAPRDYICE